MATPGQSPSLENTGHRKSSIRVCTGDELAHLCAGNLHSIEINLLPALTCDFELECCVWAADSTVHIYDDGGQDYT